jgi:hypothetical protein
MRNAERQSAATKSAFTKLSPEDFKILEEYSRKNCRTISQTIRVCLIEQGILPKL